MKTKKLLHILIFTLCIQIFNPFAVHAGKWVKDHNGWQGQLFYGDYLKDCRWYISVSLRI